MKTYTTSQIAKIAGIHPNTVRFYQDMGLLQNVHRKENGYRVFTDAHILQLRLIRLGFRAEILSSNLRKKVIEVLKTAAAGEKTQALKMAKTYKKAVSAEKERAKEAVSIIKMQLKNPDEDANGGFIVGRKQAAEELGISIDVLRDWERNGLIVVPRDARNNRIYGKKERRRLKIIRTLRNAHYSMMSILRMLTALDAGTKDIAAVLNTPAKEEDIIHATDRYILALSETEEDADAMIKLIKTM